MSAAHGDAEIDAHARAARRARWVRPCDGVAVVTADVMRARAPRPSALAGAVAVVRLVRGAGTRAPAVRAGPGAVGAGARPCSSPTRAAAELDVGDRVAWIALARRRCPRPISGDGRLRGARAGRARARSCAGRGGEAWRIERRGQTLRVAGERGDATPWRPGPFVVRAGSVRSLVVHDGARYRGELWITATDSGLLVVNRLPVEDYLRGVVPLELGTRAIA